MATVTDSVEAVISEPISTRKPEFALLVREHQSMVFSIAVSFLRDPATAEEVAQDVFAGIRLGEVLGPERVVLLALGLVREHGIGLAHVLELLFGGLVARVSVGVKLLGLLAVRSLDLVGVGGFATIVGGGPALNDMVAGHADLSCLSSAVIEPQVKGGNLKAYAIVGKNRFAGLPDVPTLVEAGYKNLDLDFWHILFAPSGTPRPIIDRLNAALRKTLADEKVKAAFVKAGMELYPMERITPEVATAMLKSEIKRWGDVIRTNNITAQ